MASSKGKPPKDSEKEEKDADGENSSVLYKESSELSTNQQDSAYSSLKHSAYSSLDPITTPATSSSGTSCTIKSTTSTSHSRETTSKSSGSSNISAIPSNTQSLPQMSTRTSPSMQDKKELSDRPTRKRKPKMCHSPKETRKFMVEKSPSGFATAKESKAAKVATLSQALGYVDQFRKTQASKNDKSRRGPNESDLNDLAINLLHASQGAGLQGFLPNVSEESEDLGEDIINMNKTAEGNGFCVAVSMHDGMVVQTTASINHVLGYPKDMWVGRNFIDFVHPQDRDTFINQVTENLGLILRDIHSTPGPASKKDTSYCKSGSFFCRIRIYNGLKSGFSVKERKTRFAPFKLSVCFLEMDCKSSNQTQDSVSNALVGPQSTYLFITAIPLVSAFTMPYEDWTSRADADPQPVFVTKHNSNYQFSNIEESVIPYLGFLPQDMNGEDIFTFVHPDDLNTLKDVFSNAMLELGRPCKSKYIRFRVRNGGYVYVNSWWSFFINPWSRQLEFVHGKHTVKKGPRHPDVFAEITKDVAETEVVDLKQTQTNQADLHNIKKINSRIPTKDLTTESSSKTRRELSSFMVTLLEEVAKSETKKLGNLGKIGTVVIGNISPHQSDSSETPPSYNQLTYNENLTRFFNSQPKTLTDKEIFDNGSNPQSTKTSEESQLNESNDSKKKGSEEDAVRSAQGSGGSGEQAQTISGSGEDNGKNSSTLQTGLSAGQVQSARDECMMSQDGSGSGSRYGSGSRGASVDTYTAPELTVDLLARHNKEMEARMLSKYKESKKTGEIRFIRDHKYNMAQQDAINRLGIQKVHAANLQNELNKIKRRYNSKPVKPMQSSSMEPGDPEAQNVANSIWRQYGEEGPSQPRFDATKMKHAHEGYVGFNQANMMERGAPSTLTGFPNLVEVPTFYMAFRGNSSNVGPQKVQLMQSGLLMHGRPGGYLGIDPATSAFHRIGDGQEGESRSSGSKIPKASKRSPNHEPELPNCLAVSSCMVCRPEAGASVQTSSKCNKKIIRPRSRTGSRATSIKGEPGSALESSASVSVKEKNLSQVKDVSKIVDHDQVCQSTSSSSLYSFLKTSDDYSLTNPNSSDGESRAPVKYHIAKPVLSEPFWNEKVVLNSDLVYTYQMELRDKETVLKEDLRKLSLTMQYKEVSEQLLEANCPLEKAHTLVNSRSTASSDDSTSNEDSGDDKDEAYFINKQLKKKDHLEKLNMFMEADAPFPLQDAETPVRAVNSENWKIYSSPIYSSKSSDTTSERSSTTLNQMRKRGDDSIKIGSESRSVTTTTSSQDKLSEPGDSAKLSQVKPSSSKQVQSDEVKTRKGDKGKKGEENKLTEGSGGLENMDISGASQEKLQIPQNEDSSPVKSDDLDPEKDRKNPTRRESVIVEPSSCSDEKNQVSHKLDAQEETSTADVSMQSVDTDTSCSQAAPCSSQAAPGSSQAAPSGSSQVATIDNIEKPAAANVKSGEIEVDIVDSSDRKSDDNKVSEESTPDQNSKKQNMVQVQVQGPQLNPNTSANEDRISTVDSDHSDL